MPARQVSDARVVAASPATIFALLSDPAKHPLIDGSGTVLAARSTGPRKLELGARFGMDMKMGAPYKILNTVVEYEEDRLIAWRHFYGHRWRWQLRDLGDGRTEVTETFDWSTARIGFLLELVKFPAKNLKGIRATLDRLEEMFPARA
ncbi:SRPBCC family protein [Actinokineospora sp. NBRC 105648]|uniref:SRPBCC family protein n=1 Tax=Actinokineospora sp. NBRC 105648 TaxID=3032206 RepID=UPI0024A0FCAC|nr:SRPBCC family protein [Actinokineospora sp. NBRC 105648]GLZ36395.1 hypothetical protein Acsp05_00200 [Actinokineospora sp. NBRC 105648]